MVAGLTPAAKAARTAFALPTVNSGSGEGLFLALTARILLFRMPARPGSPCAVPVGIRPRRLISLLTAVNRASISLSSSRLSAFGRSRGNKYRGASDDAISADGELGETFGSGSERPLVAVVANRSGVESVGSRFGIKQTMSCYQSRATGSWIRG